MAIGGLPKDVADFATSNKTFSNDFLVEFINCIVCTWISNSFIVIKRPRSKPSSTDSYHTLTYAVKLALVFPFAWAWADQPLPDANLLNNGKF